MSTSATPQVPETSIDLRGLSVVTTTKTNSTPNVGLAYNPLHLAAFEPVWFHPMHDGRYVAFLAEAWAGATIGSGGPQSYSAKTVTTVPFFAVLDPVSGSSGLSGALSTRLSGTRVLNAAITRLDSVYTVGTLNNVPFVQQFRTNELGQLTLVAEEVVDVPGSVDYDLGCYIEDFDLVLFGSTPDGHLYRARKHWGRIGTTDSNEPWRFKGDGGWFTDPALAAPESGPTSARPVSYARLRDREYLSCSNSGTAVFWTRRMVDPGWKTTFGPAPADSLYLQPQLAMNTASVPEGAKGAVPYVSTVRSASSLKVAWGCLPV